MLAGFAVLCSSLYSVASAAVFQQQLLNIPNTVFIGINVSIGSPPQTFFVRLDNEESEVWIVDACCKGPVCKDRKGFNSSASASYKSDGDIYGFGSPYSSNSTNCDEESQCLMTFKGNDTFQIGGGSDAPLIITSQPFGRAISLGYKFYDGQYDGFIGLAFPPQNQAIGGPISTPLESAIKQGLLDRPIFTLSLNELGGVITWGSVDSVNCATFNYIPLSAASYWQFKLASVTMSNYNSAQNWDSALSFGNPSHDGFTRAPISVLERLAELAGATINPDDQLYVIPCNASVADIVLTIGSLKFTLTKAFTVVKDAGNICRFAFAAPVWGGFGPQWWMGRAFYNNYCIAHNYGDQQIGFAEKLSSTLRQNIATLE